MALLTLVVILYTATAPLLAQQPSSQTNSLQLQQDSVRRQIVSAIRQSAPQSAPATTTKTSWFRQPWPSGPIEPITPMAQPAAPVVQNEANLPTAMKMDLQQPCDPLPPGEIQPLIDAAAGTHNVPPTLLHAVMERESAFRPCAVSPKGAQGLMQLMPATARELGVADAFDPRQNVDAGARLLQQLLTRYNGNLQLALSAYNAGAGRVDRAGGVPDIQETREYVVAIMKKLFY